MLNVKEGFINHFSSAKKVWFVKVADVLIKKVVTIFTEKSYIKVFQPIWAGFFSKRVKNV